jgi:two-component system OmpR family response regulator
MAPLVKADNSDAINPTPGAGNAPVRLLIIEDDQETADEIVSEFSEIGYDVKHVKDGPQGLAVAGSGHFDLIIMDRMLPGLDGLAIVAALRQANIQSPVLLMSALGEVDERVRGLKAGGDDYLTKPFVIVELVARVQALLRRPALGRGTSLRVGSLEIDLIERTVKRGNRAIELLPREFKLLEYLMRRPGQILTRAMLLEHLWNYRFVTETNLVDVHVGKLRKKIDAPGEPPMIQSVRGSGFMLIANG